MSLSLSLSQPQELQLELETALREVEDLREGRERQREMVSAVVQQRDMYRTLLAQSTPLPGDTTMATDGSGRTPLRTKPLPTTTTPISMVTSPREDVVAVDTEAAGALKELREQFETYRREKGANEGILRQQVESLRQEASALRMDNVKIAAKVWVTLALRFSVLLSSFSVV